MQSYSIQTLQVKWAEISFWGRLSYPADELFQNFTTITCVILQVTGKCGSVTVRLIPAPRGTGIVSAPVPKKLLNMAGIEDCYTSARGCTATLGNFGEI